MNTIERLDNTSDTASIVTVHGTVRWDGSSEPVSDATVQLYYLDEPRMMGEGKTDEGGCFDILIPGSAEFELFRKAEPAYFVVENGGGQILLNTQETAIRLNGKSCEVNLLIPAELHAQLKFRAEEPARPMIQVGPLLLDAESLNNLTVEDVLNLARIVRRKEVSKEGLQRINALSLELIPAEKKITSLSSTPILKVIEELIRIKEFPSETMLEVNSILRSGLFSDPVFVYNSANFTVNYYLTGEDAVNNSTARMDIYDPGRTPATVIGTLDVDGTPTYVKLVCFWLERALAAYVNPPFSMRNPAAAGKIPVYIENVGYGFAGGGRMYIDNDLPAEVLCAVAVHELFHLVQFMYPGGGTWSGSISEGGAVVAEDAAADRMNRYLDEPGTNFNGVGTQSNPNLSLETAWYKACLFWRYLAEQASSDLTEPYIGVETYRNVIEHASAGTWSLEDVKNAIEELPWWQSFYEFSYLDPARLDCTSAETIFGNYALACYLKDLGANVPDRRFDFIEDEENIYIDDVIHSIDPSAPLQTTLAPVTLTGTGTLTTAASIFFNGRVNKFANRYYEVRIAPAVTNMIIHFTADAAFTSHIFQIALIDEDGRVRDIHRTDKSSYVKFLTSLSNGKRIQRIVLVVSGANGTGDFSLSVSPATPAPDVMATRWHSVIKTEYEVSSYGWAWTWVSPDIWVDNNHDGLADGTVYFNYNNHLHIRLHNKGNLAAHRIQVQFYYQAASGGLDPAHWLPVQNRAGVIQRLTGLTLAAGASQDWSVDWSPSPSGWSHHFCIKAVITVPGDPNVDNKRVLSNFGHVIVRRWKFEDLHLLRRNPFPWEEAVSVHIIPRLPADFTIDPGDLPILKKLWLHPGEIRTDTIRVQHWPAAQQRIETKQGLSRQYPFAVHRTLERVPDKTGYYKVDPRTLPPGVEGKPLITIVHKAGNRLLGGVTLMVTVDETEEKG